jgi:hypothetical protein
MTLANHGFLQAPKPHGGSFNDFDTSPDVLEVVA